MSQDNSNTPCQDPLQQIQALYTDLATNPEKDFGWEKGKANARNLGYAPQWLEQLPDAVWESCAAVGNPFSLGPVKAGEHLLDLGCGAGADLCVAALLVGNTGQVTGVDCTVAMAEKARKNAVLCGFDHVQTQTVNFSELPLGDASIDVIISNGAINLAADKTAVLAEACRVLRPDGRFYIADMVRTGNACDTETSDEGSWADCVLGTLSPDCFKQMLEEAGFSNVEWVAYTGYKTSAGTEGARFRACK